VEAGEGRKTADLEPLVELGVVARFVEGVHGRGEAGRPPAVGPRATAAFDLLEWPGDVAESVAADRVSGRSCRKRSRRSAVPASRSAGSVRTWWSAQRTRGATLSAARRSQTISSIAPRMSTTTS
jgi:hypothetical protein